MATFAQALDEAVARLTNEFEAKAADGLETAEVFDFVFECMGEFSALAKSFVDTPDVQKKRLVVMSVRKLYRRFDPDIPLLPNVIEPFVESAFLSYVLPAAYDFVASRV